MSKASKKASTEEPQFSETVLEVIKGRSIFWPAEGPRAPELRGRGYQRVQVPDGRGGMHWVEHEPYRVHKDDPFIDGYRHNLQPAPAGAKPNPITEWPPIYQRRLAEMHGALVDHRPQHERRASEIQGNEEIPETGSEDDIPPLDDPSQPSEPEDEQPSSHWDLSAADAAAMT